MPPGLIAVGRLLGSKLLCQLDEHRTEVRAIPEKVRGAATSGEEKRQRREVLFLRVTPAAGEHEIVATIVRRLAQPRRNVVERHRAHGESIATVGADGTVLRE